MAAITLAVLFFLEGAITLHPLSIPVALGSGLFGGVTSGSGAVSQVPSFLMLSIDLLAYTALHVLAFTAVGAGGALVLKASSFWRSLIGGIVYATVTCTGLLYLVGRLADAPVALGVLGLPRVLLANAVAGAVIGTALYLGEQSEARDRAAVNLGSRA